VKHFLSDLMLLCASISALLLLFCVIGILADRFIDKKLWRDIL